MVNRAMNVMVKDYEESWPVFLKRRPKSCEPFGRENSLPFIISAVRPFPD
ncbi:hypothetical protein [Halobacillus sp. ACCC02827]